MFVTTAGIVIERKELWDELQSSLQNFPLRIVFEQSQVLDWLAFADKVQRLSPDVLFLDVTGMKDAGEQVRRIRALPQKPAVFALNAVADPAAIMEVIRAGATEYLYPPFGDALRAALERLSAEKQTHLDPLRPNAKVLGFLSAKGGCGATTIACHTAVALPQYSKGKVLVADLDLDAGMIAFLLKAKSVYSFLDAVQNLHRLDISYWKALVSNGIPGVEILTAPAGVPIKQTADAEQLEGVFYFVRTQYDWTVVDLGRGLNALSLGCVQNCDETYLVTTAEVPALHHTQQILNRLISSGYGRDKLRVVLNRPPKRMEVSVNELEQMLGASIYFVIPNDYQALSESIAEGKLVPAASSLGRTYSQLARKIAGVTDAPKKRMSIFG